MIYANWHSKFTICVRYKLPNMLNEFYKKKKTFVSIQQSIYKLENFYTLQNPNYTLKTISRRDEIPQMIDLAQVPKLRSMHVGAQAVCHFPQ